jgi:GNAT superfamily N-acetyltransferase
MPLTVRPATPADVPVMVEYNCRLARETEAKELDPDILRAGVMAALADPDRKGPYFLACDGDDVVGQMQVTFEWSDWRNGWFWWVQGVYVRADARGRGVFRLLYEHVRERAKSAGDVIGLRLYVEHDNRPAQATYGRLGMEVLNYGMMQELLRPLAPGGPT